MNKEDNNINIEVLNNNGDIKLTKKRNPRAKWQTNEYPDEYIFEDVDYVNIFSLIQENHQLKERIDKAVVFICNKNLQAELTGHCSFTTNDLLEILKGSDK